MVDDCLSDWLVYRCRKCNRYETKVYSDWYNHVLVCRGVVVDLD
jgi:hypothetical protein